MIDQSGIKGLHVDPMFKRILKWLGGIVLLAIVALAIFLINLIWFRPWSLNLFYDNFDGFFKSTSSSR